MLLLDDRFVIIPTTLIVITPAPNSTAYFCFSSNLSNDDFNFSAADLIPLLALCVKSMIARLFSVTILVACVMLLDIVSNAPFAWLEICERLGEILLNAWLTCEMWELMSLNALLLALFIDDNVPILTMMKIMSPAKLERLELLQRGGYVNPASVHLLLPIVL